MQALEKNNTIFLNKDNHTAEYFINNSKILLEQGFKKTIERTLYRINRIIKDYSIENRDRVKLLYHLIYQKHILFNEPIDAEYLIYIKRIASKPVNQTYINMCIQELKEIKEWYEKVNY